MWEKTVMSDEQIERQFAIDRSWYGDTEWEFYHELLQAQAEITGEIAYREGIKKVVEWVEKHKSFRSDFMTPGEYYFKVLCDDWQAFKKEEGL